MKALTALSKYLGCYEDWKKTIKQYNLKWTTGNESTVALQRFFNSDMSLDSMLSKVKEMIQILPHHMAESIRFSCTVTDSTGVIIQRTIEGIQKPLNPQYGKTTTPEEEEAAAADVITINPARQKHFELQLKTLRDAPRDEGKLREELLKLKERQNEQEATHILKTHKG
jgi:hypothetical protein